MHMQLHVALAADRQRALLAEASSRDRRAAAERGSATQNMVPRIPEKRITVTVSSSVTGRL
jgi:hypothetical protein